MKESQNIHCQKNIKISQTFLSHATNFTQNKSENRICAWKMKKIEILYHNFKKIEGRFLDILKKKFKKFEVKDFEILKRNPMPWCGVVRVFLEVVKMFEKYE